MPFFVSENGKRWSEEQEFTLKVTLYLKVDLSEFGLPRFFGDMELKPVDAEFKICPAVMDNSRVANRSNK